MREVLIVRAVGAEEVGGSETHETATFQPNTSSLTSLPLPGCTGQDVGNVTQPAVLQTQAEGVTSFRTLPFTVVSRDIYFVIFTSTNRVRGER